jgi:hypothetical protein
MKLDPGMHIGMHLVFFGKSGVTLEEEPKEKSSTLEESRVEAGRDQEETGVASKRQARWIWSFGSYMHGMLFAG